MQAISALDATRPLDPVKVEAAVTILSTASDPSTTPPPQVTAPDLNVSGETEVTRLLTEGHKNVSAKNPEAALELFTQALLLAEENGFQRSLAVALQQIGKLEVQKKNYWQGAKFLNCSLAIVEKLAIPDLALATEVSSEMCACEQKFLIETLDKDLTEIARVYQNYNINAKRARLRQLRRNLGQGLLAKKDVPVLLNTFSSEISSFLDLLTKECLLYLGPLPKEETLAIVCLGSLARTEMSPYSDLEFAILISSNKLRSYAENLTRILELKVINLGETPFKILKRGYYSPIPRGFSYDDGGNTPLGKTGYFELIATPSELARAQSVRFYEEDFILSNVMSCATLMVPNPENPESSKQLLLSYEKEMRDILNQQTSATNPIPLRLSRAFEMLQGHLREFKPQLDKKVLIRSFNIKAELYRFFNMAISALAYGMDLPSKSYWGRLNDLVANKTLSAEGATNIKRAMDLILALRAKAHLYYKRENDEIFYPREMQSNQSLIEEIEDYLVITPEDITIIVEIMKVMLPFYRTVEECCKAGNLTKLSQSSCFDNDLSVIGKAYEALGNYPQAKKCYHDALAVNPKDASVLLNLAELSYFAFENYDEAETYAKQALSCAHESKIRPLIPRIQTLLGKLSLQKKDYAQAQQFYEWALTTDQELYGDNNVEFIPGHFVNLATLCVLQKNEDAAMKYIGIAQQICDRCQKDEASISARHLYAIALLLQDLGHGKRAFDLNMEVIQRKKKQGSEVDIEMISYYNGLCACALKSDLSGLSDSTPWIVELKNISMSNPEASEHPERIKLFLNLSLILLALKKHNLYLENFTRAFNIIKRTGYSSAVSKMLNDFLKSLQMIYKRKKEEFTVIGRDRAIYDSLDMALQWLLSNNYKETVTYQAFKEEVFMLSFVADLPGWIERCHNHDLAEITSKYGSNSIQQFHLLIDLVDKFRQSPHAEIVILWKTKVRELLTQASEVAAALGSRDVIIQLADCYSRYGDSRPEQERLPFYRFAIELYRKCLPPTDPKIVSLETMCNQKVIRTGSRSNTPDWVVLLGCSLCCCGVCGLFYCGYCFLKASEHAERREDSKALERFDP